MAHPRLKLSNMKLSPPVVAALKAEGWTRLEHLKGQTVESLKALKGIGRESAERLVSEVEYMSASH